MKKRLISVLLAVCCILSIVIPADLAHAEPTNVPEGYEKVGTSESLNLYFNKEAYAFAVEDKRNGYVWETIIRPDSPLFDSISSMKWKNQAQCSFLIKYANVKGIKEATILDKDVELSTKKIDNGMLITADWTGIQVKIDFHVYLADDALTVDVPIETIVEYGPEYGIANIAIFPYFGTADPGANGYVFYPDGSGALYTFNPRVSVYSAEYRWSVYYDDSLDFEAIDTKYKDNNQKTIMIPAFGMKVNRNAFVGLVTQGDEDTRFYFNPAGKRVYGNYVYCEFIYRRLFYDARFNKKTPINYVQKSRVEKSRQVKFFFTEGQDADYSGMANEVREYYLSSGKMASKIDPADPVPMQVDLFMGITEDRVLVDKYIKMTTFDQAIEIIQNLQDVGIENLLILLDGWNKQGYGEFAPTNYTLPLSLGGVLGLKRLTDYAEKNNIPLGLKVDYVNAYSSTSGYNRRADLIYDLNNIIMSWRGQFLFDPIRSYNLFFKKFVPKAVRHGVTAMGFEEMGIKIYNNYKDNKIVERYMTAETWNKFGSDVQAKGMTVAYEGGNAYLLGTADYLYNVPYEDSGFFITDKTVPFYQMVVHGSVPYTTYPGNLSYDFDWIKLKWIEYGCYPYFEISYQPTDLLMNIEDNEIFSSYYLSWMEDIEKTNKEFQEMKNLFSSYMVKHEVVFVDEYSYEVIRVTYSDGSVVYINYDPYNDSTVDGIKIPAKNYVVVKGGTN